MKWYASLVPKQKWVNALKTSSTAGFEPDLNSHLWVTAHRIAAQSEQSYLVNSVHYARFIQYKGTSSRISSVKLSRESLVHLNVVLNIKSCGILPLFHCLVNVPKICPRHLFSTRLLSHILHFTIFTSWFFSSHICYEFLLCHVFHRHYVSNTLVHHLSHLVFSVAIYLNEVICLSCS